MLAVKSCWLALPVHGERQPVERRRIIDFWRSPRSPAAPCVMTEGTP